MKSFEPKPFKASDELVQRILQSTSEDLSVVKKAILRAQDQSNDGSNGCNLHWSHSHWQFSQNWGVSP